MGGGYWAETVWQITYTNNPILTTPLVSISNEMLSGAPQSDPYKRENRFLNKGGSLRAVDSLQNTDERQRGYLSLRRAALWAGVSERTLKRWTTKGLPRYQGEVRGKVLIKLTDIDAFLARRQLKTPTLDVVVSSVIETLFPKKPVDQER
jgi:hypothetical protein